MLKPLLLFILSFPLQASFENTQINMGVGMSSITFAESASSLKRQDNATQATQASQAQSGNTSIIPINIEFERFTDSRWSWVFKTSAPILPSATGNYIFGGVGKNWYFKSISNQGVFQGENNQLFIIPKWRFHIGGGLGAGYLVYLTETAKKTDIIAEIFFNGGATYSFNQKWSMRGEATIARGVGVNTSTTGMKIFVGACLSLGM
jgi:hypothetical protein